jgi:hypothetical protein
MLVREDRTANHLRKDCFSLSVWLSFLLVLEQGVVS